VNRRSLLPLVLVVLSWTVDAFAFNSGSRLSGPAPGIGTRTPATRVAGGHSFSCALRPDGSVRCWGENGFGQLGDGTTVDRLTPVPVSGLNNAIGVAAGFFHACAVVADGTVRCWGGNGFGQLGDGTTTERHAPVPVNGLSGVVEISTGGSHTCALRIDGTVRCWGRNANGGQLGDGTTTNRLTPVPVVGLSDVVSLSGGGNHTCAVRADGTAWCWGRNVNGQLGIGTTTGQTTPQQVGGIINGVAITAGLEQTCALGADGIVQCWGDNVSGQVGDGTRTDRTLPVVVQGIGTNAVAVTTAQAHSCAVLADGTARCWGGNNFGQLGDGTTTQRTTSVQVANLTNAVAITGGGSAPHTCALRADGSARCWGANSSGQLGNNTRNNSSTPVTVNGIIGLPSALAVAPGTAHTCSVRNDGTVACWGLNNLGQLGNGTTTNSSNAVAAQGVSNAVGAATGDSHSCAVIANGTVRCWGNNGFGQIGDGTTTQRSTSVQVQGITNAVAVTAGFLHSCALLANGNARCWGNNSFGKLGDGTTTLRTTPQTVSGLTNAIAIAAGSDHTCALRADGGARCWGSGQLGQLGNGSSGAANVSSTPVFVNNLTNGVNLAAGEAHNCVTRADGTARCWGRNVNGQIGDGTTTLRNTPVQVTSLSSAVAPAGGRLYSCAVRSDGTARCWGNNASGQLGNGSTASSNAPVQVSNLTFASAVAAGQGGSHTCALRANGVPSCWGLNSSGQVGDGTLVARNTPVQVPSFAANILADVELRHDAKAARATVLVNCEAGLKLAITLTLTQGSIAGVVHHNNNCSGVLTEYPVSVPLRGRQTFTVGPADAELTAQVRDGGTIVDTLEWAREVELDFAP